MTVSLTLIVSVFRHLNLENEIELKESLKSVLDLVSFWRQTKEEEFLYATNVGDRSYDDVIFVFAVSSFLQLALDVLSVNAAGELSKDKLSNPLLQLGSKFQAFEYQNSWNTVGIQLPALRLPETSRYQTFISPLTKLSWPFGFWAFSPVTKWWPDYYLAYSNIQHHWNSRVQTPAEVDKWSVLWMVSGNQFIEGR